MSPRGIRRARLLLVAVVLAWFFSPPAWRYAVPLWLPFVLALGLEIEFLVGGVLRPARRPVGSDRGPQPAALERFGWAGGAPEAGAPTRWGWPRVRGRRAPRPRRVCGP